MPGFFDRDPPVGPVAPRSTDERHAARLTVARNARDADELRRLLDILGLWPADDGQPTITAPAPEFVGGYRLRSHGW